MMLLTSNMWHATLVGKLMLIVLESEDQTFLCKFVYETRGLARYKQQTYKGRCNFNCRVTCSPTVNLLWHFTRSLFWESSCELWCNCEVGCHDTCEHSELSSGREVGCYLPDKKEGVQWSSSFYFLHLFTHPFFAIRLEQSKQTQQTLISKWMWDILFSAS